MLNEGDPPPSRQPDGEQHDHGLPTAEQATTGGRAEGSASFLRAARAGDLEKVLELLRSGTDINTCNANGLNALHLASKEGHKEVVRELIKRNALVDSATRKGNTALHIASLAGQSMIVTILVENGANVNVQSVNGFTPLYMAAQENHEDVVRYLLNHGANPALSTEDGFTPVAVALQQGHTRVVAFLLENDTRGKVRLPALHIAAKKDDTKAAALLLENDHNPDVTSKSGFTPLHIASHYGHENVAQLLLDKGANVNFQARHNISPLHVATKWGRTNMANLLLQRGAIIDSRTRDLLTPLHCAARSGHDQVVDLLVVQGAPISAKTKNGLAPLHMAAQGDHVDAARTLVYHRAPVDDVTVDYLTPLHVAAHCGHVRVAQLLLERNADPNARALNGFTPLHIACKKNRIKVVELLLKYRAAIEATTESGLTPLHVASFMGAINIVIYLLQQGANADVETVRGETPLHLAARANQTDVVRILIRNGAKVDAQARELQTPLHIASRLGNTDIVLFLLQSGANPNAATRDQYTPLHIAAKEGQHEVAGNLLDHKADKMLLTRKGFTPLHLASKYGNVEVVKLLLERGTPVDIEGKNQVAPLHVAAHYNNDRVAMLLLENGASAKAAAKNGYTSLHIAAKKNQMDIASTLLQFNADPNAKSRAGFTPLHLAAQEGHREISGLLIENGSNVAAKANNGLTAMHLCAQEDHVPVAQILHNNGAEINSKTNADYTPLHVACHFGQLNMVKFLVEHGADVGEKTRASYTPLHQAAQQGHNNCVRYLLEHGASPNEQTTAGQTPLSIAQQLGYVSVVETLRTVTETTVITETTTVDDRYKPQNPEAMNETMFSESEDEGQAAEHETVAAHEKDFSDNLTQGLKDSTAVHMIHTGEQLLQRSQELENGGAIPTVNSGKVLSTPGGFSPDREYAKVAPISTAPRASTHADQVENIEELIRRAQAQPIHTANYDNTTMIENHHPDNVALGQHVTQPSFLISFLVDARGGAMRGCRHSGVRIIVPPRKASQPIRVTCRYLRKDKLAHPPPLSEGEELASRILEMAPAGAKFLGPVILEVPHFASLRDREREIVILRSDDGQHWKEHQLEATEDAVQEVLNESFDAEDLAQLDDLHTPRITRILTNDFPMYFAVVTRVRQEVHCVGPEGGVIISSVVPRVQAIFPDGSLTKTIKVSVQAQPVPQEMVTRLHGNRVAVSPIVTVEPRRRKFHKPITLCIPLPQSNNKGMLTQYSGQQGQEPPTLRLLCSITGGSAPAQWEDITGTTQLTFTGDEVSFTTTVSARFWLMDCQTPRDAARMAQEVYNEAISIPYMAKFVVFARRTFPVEGQLRVFCMTDDKEDKTLEKQEHFKLIAKSRDVEVLKGKHQFLEFAGNLVPITKSGDQLSLFFLPFQENRLAFMVKTRNKEDSEAATEGKIAFMAEPKIRAESLPPQQPICTLAISLPEYTGEIRAPSVSKKDTTPFGDRYKNALNEDLPEYVHQNMIKGIGADWPRLARALEVPHRDIQYIRQNYPGQELRNVLKIWIHLKKEDATPEKLDNALRQIGRDDIVRSIAFGEPEVLNSYSQSDSPSQKREPIRTFEEPVKYEVKRETRVEDLVTREPIKQEPEAESYSALHHSPVPEIPEEDEEQEEEAPVSELRTVVRTERHVHDTPEGPVVEERTITTTYEDDVAVNEHIVDRTVPLNEEEQQKWDELNRLAEEAPFQQQSEDVRKSIEVLPEDVEQKVETERHVEDDGTIVTTTVTTSHISETESHDHPDDSEATHAENLSDSGTTQKKETAEEGFTNEDGSVVVSKKMTRVVTTTRTTLPGEGEEPTAPDSPAESLGSVKERIAKFEQLKDAEEKKSSESLSTASTSESPHQFTNDDEKVKKNVRHTTERTTTTKYTHEHRYKPGDGTEEDPRDGGELNAAQSPTVIEDDSIKKESKEFYSRSTTTISGDIAERSKIKGTPTIDNETIQEEQSHPKQTLDEVNLEIDSLKTDNFSPSSVGIVITPNSPVPPIDNEIEEEKEPLSPLEEKSFTAEIKNTSEYDDEELSAVLHPSEEQIATAEIKDIKSYSPTSSEEEFQHTANRQPALETHYVAETFDVREEAKIEPLEQTPRYTGHDDHEQTSPIISEKPVTQEYAESITSYDEENTRDLSENRSDKVQNQAYNREHGLKQTTTTAEIHSESLEVTNDEDEKELDQMQYQQDKLSHQASAVMPLDSERELSQVSEETSTTVSRKIIEEPEHEGFNEPEQYQSQKYEEPHPAHIVDTTTTTTITRQFHDEPEHEGFDEAEHQYQQDKPSHPESTESPVPSEKDIPHVIETTETTATRDYYDEPQHEGLDEAEHQYHQDEPSHPESTESPVPSEKDIPHVIETTETTATRDYYDEPQHEGFDEAEHQYQQDKPSHPESTESPVPSEKDIPHVIETTETTATRDYYDEPQHEGFDEAEHQYQQDEPSHPESTESPVPSEKEIPHVIESIETTATHDYYNEPEHEGFEEREHFREDVQSSPDFGTSQVAVDTDGEEKTGILDYAKKAGMIAGGVVAAPVALAAFGAKAAYDALKDRTPDDDEQSQLIKEMSKNKDDSQPQAHPESTESPVPSEKEIPHAIETTTTTTITREFHDEPEHEGFDDREHQYQQDEPSHPESTESPVPSEKEIPHVIETTETTATRDYYEEPQNEGLDEAEHQYHQDEPSHPESTESPVPSEKEIPHVIESTTKTTVTRELHDKPQDEGLDEAEHQYQQDEPSHPELTESPVPSEKEIPHVTETTETTAIREYYDEPQHEELDKADHQYHQDEPSHPESTESPVPSEKEIPHVTETTETTATRNYYDEPQHEGLDEAEHQYHQDKPSHPESTESPVPSEKEIPHVIETTTTTTITREFHDEPQHERLDEAEHQYQKDEQSYPESTESPVPSEKDIPHVIETTTTTTVTREFHDEPEHEGFDDREHQYQKDEPSHPESTESPVPSEKDIPHLIESTETTATRDYYDEPQHERLDEVEHQYQKDEQSYPELTESPVPSEKDIPHVIETTTTTTVTREFHDEPEHEGFDETEHQYQQDEPSHPESTESPVPSEKDIPHLIESTETTATRDYYDEPQHERLDEAEHQYQKDEPSHPESTESPVPSEKDIPHVIETTTTTTITREFHDEPEHEGFDDREHQYQKDEPSHPESTESPVPSEKDIPHLIESTETTATRDYYDEPQHERLDEAEHQYQKDEQSYPELTESPVPSEKDISHVIESTETTAARDYYNEPEHEGFEERGHVWEDVQYSPDFGTSQVAVDTDGEEKTGILDYAKKAGMIAGGVVAAPVALAAFGAKTAYDALKVRTPEDDEQSQLIKEMSKNKDDSQPQAHPESTESPVPSEKEIPHAIETTTTTTVTREFHYEPEHEGFDEREHQYHQDEPSHPEPTESPVPSEKEIPHVTETTETTHTRDYYDEPQHERLDEAEHQYQKDEQSYPESTESPVPSEKDIPHVIETTTTTTITREFHDEPEHEGFDEREQQYHQDEPSHPESTESPVPSEKDIPHLIESTETTDTRDYYDEPQHEGFDEAEHQYQKDEQSYPESTESPVPSEKDIPHVIETTTTTTITREFHDEPEHEGFDEREQQYHQDDPLHPESTESPVPSEKEIPHVIETTTTTTVTREFHDEPEHEGFDEAEQQYQQNEPSHPESTESPVPSEIDIPHVIESTETTDTRDYYDEPQHEGFDEAEHQYQKDEQSYPESTESPVPSEKDIPHVIETTTTTTVTREFHDEPEHEGFDETEHQYHQDEPSHPQSTESPVPSEIDIPHVIESTETTATQDYYKEPEHEGFEERGHVWEDVQSSPDFGTSQVAVDTDGEEKTGILDYAKKAGMIAGGVVAAPVALAAFGAKAAYDALKDRTPEDDEQSQLIKEMSKNKDDSQPQAHPESTESPVPSEKEIPHAIEKTTTTTVTREFHDEPEHEGFDEAEYQYQKDEPSHPESTESPVPSEKDIPHVIESTETTDTRDYYDEPQHERLDEAEHQYQKDEPSHPESTESPVPSEKEIPHVIESAETTATRDYYDEPQHEGLDEAEHQYQKDEQSYPESTESPVPSEKDISHDIETATTTTVAREFHEEPEHEGFDEAEQQYQQDEPSHLESTESPVPSETDIPHVIESTETTDTRDYYDEPQHEGLDEAEHQYQKDEQSYPESTESPVPSEKDISHDIETATTTTVAREFHEESEHERFDEAEHQYHQDEPSHPQSTESPVPSEKDISHVIESTETTAARDYYNEPEHEGFEERGHVWEDVRSSPDFGTSQVAVDTDGEEKTGILDYAKKAGMIAGGVVAAPVALAAFGAKAAYDALKDRTPEDDEQSQLIKEMPKNKDDSQPQAHPESTESPVPSEKEIPQAIETTTTTTVAREFHEEPVHEGFDEPEHQYQQDEPSHPESTESPVPSEKDIPHVIETTTTTTVTREFHDEPEHEGFDEPEHQYQQDEPSHPESTESPVPSEKDIPHVIETTTTTTVTREFHDEPEHEGFDEPEHQYQQDEPSHPESTESPVPSEKEIPHAIETATTTTVAREFHEEPEHEGFDEAEQQYQQDEPSHLESTESPVPSETDIPHVIESTETTDTRDYYDEPQHERLDEAEHQYQKDEQSYPESTESPVPSEKDISHDIETATTTTVAREFHEEPEHERFDEAEHQYHQDEPSHPQSTESPVPSEKDISHVIESTETTATRDYYNEPEHEGFEERGHVWEDVRSSPDFGTSQVDVDTDGEEKTGILDYAKKAGMIAGGVVAAPVALAAFGAKAAYDALKDRTPEDDEQSQLIKEMPKNKDDSQPQAHPESTESPVPSEKEIPQAIETTTTTTVAREFHEEPVHEGFDEPEHQYQQDEPSHPESTESPVPSEKDIPHVIETTTTTTVTREFHDEPEHEGFDEPEHQYQQDEPSHPESTESPVPSEKDIPHVIETTTTTTVTREFHDEPEHEGFDEPEHQYQQDEPSHPESTESPVPSEKDIPHVIETTTTTTVTREFHDEPEHEGFDEPEHQYQQDEPSHPESTESPVPSEKDIPHVIETTTTTTVTREFHDEPEQEGFDEPEHQYQQDEPSHPESTESPVPSEKDIPHVIETATTTTVAREFHEEPEHEGFDEPEHQYQQDEPSHPESTESPVPSEKDIPHVIETTTTTTVTREFHDEPEHEGFDEPEHQYQQDEPSHPESTESPVPSEKDIPHVIETTTTTTVTREFHDEPEHEGFDEREQQYHQDEPSHPESTESPVPSEKDIPHVIETATTTTVAREFHEEPEHEGFDEPEHQYQQDEPSHPESTESPVPSEKDIPHVIETTTTTTVTREFHDEPEHEGFDEPEHQYQQDEPSHPESTESPVPSEKDIPHVIETTTTTTVTREFHDEPEHEGFDEPEHQYQQDEPSHPESSESPVPSEKEIPHVIETTTTTTVTREFHDEPEHEGFDEPEHQYQQDEPSHPESTESPVPSEKEIPHVIETTTTTTVTREFHDEPEHEGFDEPERQYQQDEPSHPESSDSPVPSEKEIPHVIETTTTTTVTREFHDEPEHEGFDEPERQYQQDEPSHPESSDSPVPSEKEIPHVIETTTSSMITSEFLEKPDMETSGEQDFEDRSETKNALDSAKKVGMIAGGIIGAPLALAVIGAKKAYDVLNRDSNDDQGDFDAPHVIDSHEYVERNDVERVDSPVLTENSDNDKNSDYDSNIDLLKESKPIDAVYTTSEQEKHLFTKSTAKFEMQEDTAIDIEKNEEYAEPHVIESKEYACSSDEDMTTESHLETQSSTTNLFPVKVANVMEQSLYEKSSDDDDLSQSLNTAVEKTATQLVSDVFVPLERHLVESSEYRSSIESLHKTENENSVKSTTEDQLASEALSNVKKMSYGDESDVVDDEWKVYDRNGEILEEFSTQLTEDVIQEAEDDASQIIAEENTIVSVELSPRTKKFLKQESCQEVANEPEVDYYSDLQEKLEILANEGKEGLQTLPEEEPSITNSDQLDVIHESDKEGTEEDDDDKVVEKAATELADSVMNQVINEMEDREEQKTVTSDTYITATEHSRDDQYDTCVTSQDDTYESAQGWTSQDSEYTSATSGAPSRLSDSDRNETSTPRAILSPVDSDRHFTSLQDYEMPVIKAFDIDDYSTTARSTPDVPLQVTIEEEEEESDDKLPISPSGVLLPPSTDPGRPLSPVPPRKDQEEVFVFVQNEDVTEDEKKTELEISSIHGIAMEAKSDDISDSRYSRQTSDMSSGSHADTIIHKEKEADQEGVTDIESMYEGEVNTNSGSSDSLDHGSVISGSQSSVIVKDDNEAEAPDNISGSSSARNEKPIEIKQIAMEQHDEAKALGFEVYSEDTEEKELPEQTNSLSEELETVEEEPEDSDSLNGGSGNSSVGIPGDSLSLIGKYKHVSTDNLSLTSLQEFERLEKEVGTRGDGSLTRSEIELLVSGRMSKSGEGSVSSLAEFEKLEKEMTDNNGSPSDEVMMLSDIREESEAEDMSIRGDDEEDGNGSDEEMKSRPLQEEDLVRVTTPTAPSPTDSLEQNILNTAQMQYLETSTDSLEPNFQDIEVEQTSERPQSVEDTSLTEYEVVPRVMETSATDSLDIHTEQDSLLEGGSSQGHESQSTHGLLSGDTVGTLADDDKDSLDGDMTSMLRSYPTTLTTFKTTSIGPDGTVQTISRRVETRVTDPLISHVTFTGTESQERIDQLPDEEQFETVDSEGNVTRTTYRREHQH